MIYTKLTNLAMQIAYNAHHGQTDKSGLPYIFHPYHLAEQMDDEYSVCVALLHDVVEDTDITIAQLEKAFPEPITQAIQLMTHNEDMPYLTYIAQIKANPLARKVKLADLHHNSDESRLLDACDTLRKRYRTKYQEALKLLEENEE